MSTIEEIRYALRDFPQAVRQLDAELKQQSSLQARLNSLLEKQNGLIEAQNALLGRLGAAPQSAPRSATPPAPLAAAAMPFEKEWVINYPTGGTAALSGVGVNSFDFLKGSIIQYDGTTSSFQYKLSALGFPFLKALGFITDTPAVLKLTNPNGKETQRIFVDQFNVVTRAVLPFDKMSVTYAYPAIFTFVATTSDLGWQVLSPALRMQRYSSGTTTSSFAAIQWQALVGSGTSAAKSNAGSAYTSSSLYVGNCGTKTLLVFNTDAADDLDVDLQGSVDGTNFVDDASTGASTKVTHGNSLGVQVTTPYQLMRLRIQDDVAGSHASFVAAFVGSTT